jgi:carbon monoxide dehydrogenase subunit G
MLHFEGDKDLHGSPGDASVRLSDARFLIQCIPGVESVSSAQPDRAVCVLRPGFSFVRGTLEVTLTVVEAVAGTTTRLSLHSKGIGSSSDVDVVLAYVAQDAATRVHWTADIQQLGGLLKAVPQGLIKGAAQRVIADVWAAVETQLSDKTGKTG